MTPVRLRLFGVLFVAALVSGTLSAPAVAVEDQTASGFETVLRATNDYRQSNGVDRVVHDPRLSAVAQAWAEQMATDYATSGDMDAAFRHNPNMRTEVPSGWESVGENIAMNGGYPQPYDRLLELWRTSPPHNANMLNSRWTHIGVGTYQDDSGLTWGVQVFGDYGSPDSIPDPGAAVVDLDDLPYSGTPACVVLVSRPSGAEFFRQCGTRPGNRYVFSDVPPGAYSTIVLASGDAVLYSGWPTGGGTFTVASGSTTGLPSVAIAFGANPVTCVDDRLIGASFSWNYASFGGPDGAAEAQQSHDGIQSVTVTQSGQPVTGMSDILGGDVLITVVMKTGYQYDPARRSNPGTTVIGNVVTITTAISPYPGHCGPREFPGGITRLYGENRYDTAVQVSRQYGPGVPAVFVAAGTNFPDALSAAAAASHLGGPLLLTTPGEVPANVVAELQRLNPGRIYIAGGPSAVSASAEVTLAGIAPVTRYGGTDRYATALQIVEGTFATSTSVILASGRAFPDALAATGVAGKLDAPVILVDGLQSTIPSATLAELDRMGVVDVIIAGGAGAISQSIETQLTMSGYTVSRFGGADRYETAALINNAYFAPGSTTTMFLANGTNFPDGLAGSALAGLIGAPLYTTSPTCTPAPIHHSIVTLAPAKVVVLGGPAVLTNGAANNQACT